MIAIITPTPSTFQFISQFQPLKKSKLKHHIMPSVQLDTFPTVCGFSGIIPGERCPSCGRLEGEIPFERLRRITGYLVGSLDRWNDAKRAEEHDRVKHNVSGTYNKAEKAAREHAKHTAKSSLGKA